MARTQQFTNEQILAALHETKGMVYLAAQRVGCSHETIYARAKRSPEIANAIKAERGKVVDTAELKLYNAILNGEPWAIQLCLKTLGKDRGYVEKQEVSHTGPPVQVRIVRAVQPPPRVLIEHKHDGNGDG